MRSKIAELNKRIAKLPKSTDKKALLTRLAEIESENESWNKEAGLKEDIAVTVGILASVVLGLGALDKGVDALAVRNMAKSVDVKLDTKAQTLVKSYMGAKTDADKQAIKDKTQQDLQKLQGLRQRADRMRDIVKDPNSYLIPAGKTINDIRGEINSAFPKHLAESVDTAIAEYTTALRKMV